MKTRVARRQIAAAAEPRGDLGPARDGHGHPAPTASRLEVVPSSASVRKWFWDVESLIVEQGQRGVLGDEQQVDAAVVVEVAGGQSAAQPGDLPGVPGAVRDVE